MGRTETKKIQVGNVIIGGQNKVVIQSMCNIKTENYLEVAKQLNECAALGAEIMRVSIMDEKDALAIKEIKKLITIPLVGDIHVDYRLAVLAIINGIDKIRINPGNIGSEENLKQVIEKAKEFDIPIRIGVNSGSIEKEFVNAKMSKSEKLVLSVIKYVKI